jgi:hypothetical protein
LEPGLDSVVVENRRLMYRQPDAHAYSSTPHANAYTDSNTNAHTDPNADAESRPRMRRGSNLDRDRDLYGRPAGESQRHPL